MSTEGEDKPAGDGADNVLRPLFGKPAQASAGDGSVRPAGPEDRAGQCPVVVLGHDDGFYFVLTPEGQFRTLKGARMDARALRTVFGTQIDWLWDAAPRFNTADPPARIGWVESVVGEFLIKRAHRLGLFNPERSVRGTGVWRGKDKNGAQSLIVHCGDRVLIDGEWHGAGIRHAGFIYPAFPPETPPAEAPASSAELQELFELINQWGWRTPAHAPRLLLGFIGCGAVAGALRWRPHVQITGAQGTGKTWLDDLIKRLWGSLMLAVSSPTEPSIRQLLKGSARPVMVDEMEPDNMERARRVIELARLASTDSQSPVSRGSADGKATQWPIRGCFLFSSILHPKFRPQDLSRICVLELGALSAGERTDGELQQNYVMRQIEKVGQLGPALRRRMMDGFRRFEQNLMTYEAAMGGAGVKARAAAQIGTLLAAADTLLLDAPIDTAHAERFIADFLVPEFTGHEDEEDHAECLQHLLTSSVYVEFDKGGAQVPISEALAKGRGRPGGRYDAALRQQGLAVVVMTIGEGKDAQSFSCLAVANAHRGLDKIFEGTRWAEGGWKQALSRVKDAERVGPVSFAGAKTRAVQIPFASLMIELEKD